MFDRINKGQWWDRALTLVEGCTPVSAGCDNCWAAALAHRFIPSDKEPNEQSVVYNNNLTTNGIFNGKIITRSDRLKIPLKVKNPTAWAIWNDLFHEDVPLEFAFNAIEGYFQRCNHHIFIILTKRPERVLKLYQTGWDIPHNVWLGTTAENQEIADKRGNILKKLPAAVKFLSIEPMLSSINYEFTGIDWVICGCESGSHRRPTEWSWIQSLNDQCKAANVPFFLKQGELGGKVRKAPYSQYLELPNV